MQREAMSRVDTAWLRMERPSNRMMITGVLKFDGPLALVGLKAVLAERFLAYHRFRQRPVVAATGCWWEADPAFDLDWHVRAAALPGAAGEAELEDYVSELASTSLDPARPLWQFHLVERCDGGSVLVARIHHCYADGLALVQVLLSITDTASRHVPDAAFERAWLARDRGNVLDRLLEPVQGGLQKVIAAGSRGAAMLAEAWSDPAVAAKVAHEGSEITRELAIALTLADDPPTGLRGPLGTRKRVAIAPHLRLDEVKAIGKVLGCTVNDVLLACAAGALRGYLRDRGEDVDGLAIRATVPVNLRPLEHARKLGNHFGLVFLDLPIGVANPLRRLELVASSMRELKGRRQAVVAFGLLAALGMAPPALQGPALELFSRKASAVATNVPGPQQPLYVGGARLRDLMFWVPQTGSIGLGLSILSYDGHVSFGVIADVNAIPEPQVITARFVTEFEKLALIVLMEAWDGTIEAADAAATLHRWASGDAPKAATPERQREASRHATATGGKPSGDMSPAGASPAPWPD